MAVATDGSIVHLLTLHFGNEERVRERRRRRLGFDEQNPWSQYKEERIWELGFDEENPWSQEEEERIWELGFDEENPWSQEEEERIRELGFDEENPWSRGGEIQKWQKYFSRSWSCKDFRERQRMTKLKQSKKSNNK